MVLTICKGYARFSFGDVSLQSVATRCKMQRKLPELQVRIPEDIAENASRLGPNQVDRLSSAARAIHADGIEGFQTAVRLVGQETAVALMFLHQLMKRSPDVWPPQGFIHAETLVLLEGAGVKFR